MMSQESRDLTNMEILLRSKSTRVIKVTGKVVALERFSTIDGEIRIEVLTANERGKHHRLPVWLWPSRSSNLTKLLLF